MTSPSPSWRARVVEDEPVAVVVGLTGGDSVVVVVGSVVVVVVVVVGAKVDVVVDSVVGTDSCPVQAATNKIRQIFSRSRVREDDRACLLTAIGSPHPLVPVLK